MVGLHACLEFELADEFRRLVNLLPDAWQKQALPAAIANDQAVDVGAQRADQIHFALARYSSRRRQDRDMNVEPLEFFRAEWRKARIAEARLPGVVGYVEQKRTVWNKRAAAAAQLVADCERDERRALRQQRAREHALDIQPRRLSIAEGGLLDHLAGEID